jgi:hypothetical protein
VREALPVFEYRGAILKAIEVSSSVSLRAARALQAELCSFA